MFNSQALSTKLTTNLVNQPTEPSNDSNAATAADTSLLDRSANENERSTVSVDQLLTVIKYMRKEKDIAHTKLDILKTENVRLSTETTILQKKLSEVNQKFITSTGRPTSSSEQTSNVISWAKHQEILLKVENLNAITDSNRLLREERDALTADVARLTERVTKVEDELFPLQEKNRELAAKIDEQGTENQSLRNAAEQWRKRATSLVERSNKNPEDFKRLQNERENLAKMLTAEKEVLRIVNEELTSIRTEKTRLDAELAQLQQQCTTHVTEKKRLSDDLNQLKQLNVRMTHEIMELKNSVLLKEDELKKIAEDLNVKEAALADAKSKEVQIRKIAKRYKDSFYEQKTRIEELEAINAAKPLSEQVAASAEAATAAAARLEAEQVQAARLDELTAQMTALQEETDQLRRENEQLKKTDEKNLLGEARARIKALTEANAQMARDFQASKNALQSCEQNRSEHDLFVTGLKSQYEVRINRVEKEMVDQDASNKETIARLTRENETLNLRVNQLHRQLQQQGSKPSTSSGAIEKSPSDAARTANVKPMAGPSGQQSATVPPRRGGDTPLASIRPMSVQNNSRTAAVLPTSQTSNVAAVQGSASSGSSSSVTALVPPQQQVHTTGQSSSTTSSSAEAMSSSPTSSHTDYMPATSSAVVAAVPPMGSTTVTESSQEAESATAGTESSPTSAQAQAAGQQAVALVLPRIEVSPQNVIQTPPQPSPHQVVVAEQNQAAASTSGGGTASTSSLSSASSSMQMSSTASVAAAAVAAAAATAAASAAHHQAASSSNTVTTTQAVVHKRPRDSEGDSSTGVEDSASASTDNKTSPKNKRLRGLAGSSSGSGLVEQAFQGVSESGLDVEYQVPTSSQRDQEDDNVIALDSEDDDEDDGMVDEGTAEQFEDEADNGESYEMEESYDQEQDDEGDGPDIDEHNVRHDTNEVEVDDSSDAPNQSVAATAVVAAPAATSDVGTSAAEPTTVSPGSQQQQHQQQHQQQQQETQQIQAISSGSEARSSTTWHADMRPAASQQLIIQQPFEETGDDSIVPSTPTLYVPRRGGDG